MKSTLRDRLIAAKTKAGLTQDQCAKIVGLTRSGFAQWTNANAEQRVNPPAFKLALFAEATRVPLDWLMDDDSDPRELFLVSETPARPRFSLSLVPAPTPAAVAESRLSENFWRAVEYTVVSEQPELEGSFGVVVANSALNVRADWLRDRTLVAFANDAEPETVMRRLGEMLIVERAARRSCDKTILVWDKDGSQAVDCPFRQEIQLVFGVRIAIVSDVTSAAQALANQ